MGAGMSNPLDEEALESIKTRTNDIIQEFSKQFPLCYKDALIAKIKAEKAEGKDAMELDKADDPDWDLKEGAMMKRGAVNTAWKKRKFVVKNKSENYRVYYYSDTSSKKDIGKPKGPTKGFIDCWSM